METLSISANLGGTWLDNLLCFFGAPTVLEITSSTIKLAPPNKSTYLSITALELTL